MGSLKRKVIKVIDYVVSRNGVNYPVTKDVHVSMNAVMFHGGSNSQMVNLSGSEKSLLMYLAEIMDDRNTVRNDIRMKEDFVSYMAKSNVRYSIRFVEKMFLTISKSELLISSGKRGLYYVNPLYISKAGTNRLSLIKELYETKILK